MISRLFRTISLIIVLCVVVVVPGCGCDKDGCGTPSGPSVTATPTPRPPTVAPTPAPPQPTPRPPAPTPTVAPPQSTPPPAPPTPTPTLACTLKVDPTLTIGYQGGPGVLQVTASRADCPWTASLNSNPGWVIITSGASGLGKGSTNFFISGNSGPARTVTGMIAGKTITIVQATR